MLSALLVKMQEPSGALKTFRSQNPGRGGKALKDAKTQIKCKLPPERAPHPGCFPVKTFRSTPLTHHLQPFKKFSGWAQNSDQEPLRYRGALEKL